MHRFLFLLLLLLSAELRAPAPVAAQSESAAASTAAGLPARPSPFRFVTDEAKLLSPADAKTLESGLRRYADNTGTQIVVVTVPTLGGRTVADYGRALGQAWGVGQREKNNGIVVLLSGQERKVTIQPGSGLQSVITPEVTARIINDQMTPSFKQGKYFAGIRTGLNTLMLAANPESNPNKNQPAATTAPATASGAAAGTGAAASSSNLNTDALASTDNTPNTEPFSPQSTVPAPQSSGLGIGTLAIGALLIGGVIWVLVRLFRRKSQAAAAAAPGNAPDFYGNGNRPNNPAGNYNRGNMPPQQQGGPDFYGNRGPNMGGSGFGGGMGGGMGSGMGGILATGAAAAAGAYLGNRMASGGHDDSSNGLMGHNGAPSSLDPGATGLAGAAGAVGGASSADEFPAFSGTGTNDAAPDYFSQDDSSLDNSSPDYFSSDDNSSYDDTSSDDTGGGGFDSDDDNSGSW